MFVRLIKYMRGYVKLRLMGFSPERFMNLCCNHDILLWDVINYGQYYELCMSVSGFFELKSIVKKTKTKVVVLERHGLPFFLHKYRKRKLFFAGFIGCIAALYILSIFIWDIRIEGNYARTTDVIMTLLESENIYSGMRKKEINCEYIEKLLRETYFDITWASAQIDGTRLVIQIKENEIRTADKDEESQFKTASDLIASTTGTIVSIVTRTGTPSVIKEQEIQKGDMLVSGKVPVLNDAGEIVSYQYVGADADIYLKTVYNYTDSFSLKYEKKVYTGRVKKQYYMKLGEWKLQIPVFTRKFAAFDVIDEGKQAKLFSNMYLPLEAGIRQYKEYEIQENVYTKQEAGEAAKQNLIKFCATLEEKGVQIIEKNVTIKINDNLKEKSNCTTRGKIKVIEKTGALVPTEVIEIEAAPEEES